MTHPTNVPDFRAALLAYEPEESIADGIFAAQSANSPVVQAVGVFDLLGPVADLDQDGLRLLLGAAHLIAFGGWHGKARDAATVLATRAGNLT